MPLDNSKRTWTVTVITVLIASLVAAGIYYYLRSKSSYQAATNPTIYVQSSKTAFGVGEQITASIIVDGAGAGFTSFKANVALTNLTVVSFTIGTAVTNWQTTPTSASLNFLGAVQGTTTANVTVYTLTLQANAVGAASINLTNGAIYQVQSDGVTVTNILAALTSATYTIQATPTVSAGADKAGYPVVPYALIGSVDNAGDTLLWSKVSGPGSATFTPASTLTPTVSVTLPGAYVLQLTATNLAAMSASDTLTFIVHKPGDIDGDGIIGDLDFTLLLRNWGTPTNLLADLNNSSPALIDITDFTILLANWPPA